MNCVLPRRPALIVGAAGLCVFFIAHVYSQPLSWVETAFGDAVLRTVNDNGVPVRTVPLLATSLPEGLVADSRGNSYWTELQFSGARIIRAGPMPGDVSTIVEGGSALRGIALDPSEQLLYWASSNLAAGPGIYRIPVSGGQPETLAVSGLVDNPRGIAVDSTHVYWTEFDRGVVMRLSLGSAGVPDTIISGLEGPCGLALDRTVGKIYWSEMNGNRIGMADTNGTGRTIVLSGLSRPAYLGLSPGGDQIAWSELDPPRIRWAEIPAGVIASRSVPAVVPGGLILTGRLTAVREPAGSVPRAFALEQNFPNPFNGESTITFSVFSPGYTSLVLYDVLGRRVQTLFEGRVDAGTRRQVRLDASALGSGVYFYRLVRGGEVAVRKLLVTR